MKKVVFTHFTLGRAAIFTPDRRTSPHFVTFRKSISESSSARTTKTGGSDPAFSAYRPPKKFLGSLPLVLFRSRMHEQLSRTSGEPVIANAFTLAFTSTLTPKSRVSSSARIASFDSIGGESRSRSQSSTLFIDVCKATRKPIGTKGTHSVSDRFSVATDCFWSAYLVVRARMGPSTARKST